MKITHKYNDQNIDKKDCLNVLTNNGFGIMDKEKIEFSENHNFTTHSGKNNRNLFVPLLKGSLHNDPKKKQLNWQVKIDGILFKSFLTAVLISVIFGISIEGGWTLAILTGLIMGILVFLVNWHFLKKNIDSLSLKICSTIQKT